MIKTFIDILRNTHLFRQKENCAISRNRCSKETISIDYFYKCNACMHVCNAIIPGFIKY